MDALSYRAPTLGAMATPAPATCESCGVPADDLASVHRVYVTPEAWDRQEKVDVVDDVEQWCFPCRSMYPHQPV
jgi:hypothetical protein